MAEDILDGLNQARSGRKLGQGGHQSCLQAIHDRLRLGLPDGTPLSGTAPPDPRLDRINLAQAADDVARERGVGGLVDGDELATGVGQTECELDLGMTAGQPLVAPVPVYPRVKPEGRLWRIPAKPWTWEARSAIERPSA